MPKANSAQRDEDKVPVMGIPDIDLYEEMPALCMMVDCELRIRKINGFGCEQLGYQKNELIGKHVELLCVVNEREFFCEKLRSCLADSESLKRFEVMHARKDGSRYWVRNTTRIIERPGDDTVLLIVSEDITETRYLINELERQSAIDMLTGLYSRRRFDRELEQTVLSAKIEFVEHVLCYIDLDQFKVVNDSCGHQAGDELLRQIAKLLQKHIRSNDILARLGGDEFGLILESCSIAEAKNICEKILVSLARHRFTWNDDIFSVGASIGVLSIDSSSGSATELLRQVDSACYMAKDRGRNCIQVYNLLDAETQNRGQLMRWLSRLHWAFENGRFELYRQRIQGIRPEYAHMECYELLVRMRDYDDNLVLPGAFIPAAEYYGLASQLDSWVTQSLLANAMRYKLSHDGSGSDDKTKRMFFVNLSGLTLGDSRFIQEISGLIKAHASENFQICFEITETAAIQNMSAAIEFMHTFKELGCLFALDDFGSGFSSFTYLKTLPVDFIKIDGEFVKNICSGPMEKSLIKAIHEVAVAFGKQTIAEYVENKEIFDRLVELGIDYAQGYYVDKPVAITLDEDL